MRVHLILFSIVNIFPSSSLLLNSKYIVSSLIHRASNFIEGETSFKSSIYTVIDDLLANYLNSNKIDPIILSDNSYLLTNEAYSVVMNDLLNSCEDLKSVKVLEYLDSVIRSFIVSEKKSRSRLKLNYLVSGASSNRLEEAIELLSSTDEIDDELLVYIDSCIDRKKKSVNTLDSSDEKPVAVNVLKMIRTRLEAEKKVGTNHKELKLLSNLLVSSSEDYISLIKSEIKSIENFRAFSSFLNEAINFLSYDNDNDKSQSESSSLKNDAILQLTSNREKNYILLVNIREIERILQIHLSTLETGLIDKDDLFSTSPEDYIQGKSSEDIEN